MNLETFAEIVRSRLHESGLSASGAALNAGLPRDAIRSVLRGHPPTITRAAQICDALGLEFYVGPPRPRDSSAKGGHHPQWTDRFRSDLRAGIRVDMSSLLHEHHHKMAQRFDEQEEMVRRHGDGPDPKKWVILTALVVTGRGLTFAEQGATYVAFRRDWLARRGMSENCVVIAVGGKTLDPPLPYPASTVLVDRDARKLVGGRVFLLMMADRLLMRRAVWKLDQWMMATEETRDEPDPWPEDAAVIGEVRFVSGALRDEVEGALRGG